MPTPEELKKISDKVNAIRGQISTLAPKVGTNGKATNATPASITPPSPTNALGASLNAGTTPNSTQGNQPTTQPTRPNTMPEKTGYSSSLNFNTSQDQQSPVQTLEGQLTSITQKALDNSQASLKLTEQEKQNTIDSISAEGKYNREALQTSYDASQSKINQAISLLGSQFAIDSSKVQSIVDSQKSLFNTFQTSLTQLDAQEKEAINNADLTQAKAANQQAKDVLSFMSDLVTQKLTAAKEEKTNAINEIKNLVDTGGLATSSDEDLLALADKSGYDVYTLANMRASIAKGNEADAAKSLADLQKTQADTELTKANIAKVPGEIAQTEAQTELTKANISRIPYEIALTQAQTAKALGYGSAQDVAAQYGLDANDPIFMATSKTQSPTIMKEQLSIYAGMMKKGDTKGAQDYLNKLSLDQLSASQKAEFSNYTTAAKVLDTVINDVDTFKKANIGVYNSAVQKAAPFVNLKRDQNWVKVTAAIEEAQAQIRKGFFGTALTKEENQNGDMFLINFNKDDIDTVMTKIANIRSMSDSLRNSMLSMGQGNFYGISDTSSGSSGSGSIDYTSELDSILNQK